MPRTPKPDYTTEPHKPLPGSARPPIAAAAASRAKFRYTDGSDPSAIKAVADFARCFHLTAASEPCAAHIILTGTVVNMENAFSISLGTPSPPYWHQTTRPTKMALKQGRKVGE